MPINLAAIRDLLLPGLKKVDGDYQMIKPQYLNIFQAENSDMANERLAEMRLLYLAQLKSEGQAISFDNNPGERFLYNLEHVTFGLGYAITREAIEDNQYESQFNIQNLNLRDAFLQTKEIVGANILNLGNVFNAQIGGDGQALMSTAHPIDGATVANRPLIDMDLSEASLLTALINIRQNFKDAAGLKIYARGETLLVPPALWPVADRLVNADLRPGTSDNDPNALKSSEGGLRSFKVLDFLTSPYAWFVKTNIPGLIHYKRRPFESDMDTDQTSQQLLVTATERYSFGHRNWRAVWGTFPTS